MKEYEDLAVEYATNNGRASRQNYKYSGMRFHGGTEVSQSSIDTDKWISKLLNGFKGTRELNHIGDGRNRKFITYPFKVHHISLVNRCAKIQKFDAGVKY